MSTLTITLLIALLILPFVRKLAIRVQLVDSPSERKRHAGSVPVVGGIALYLAILLYSLIFAPSVYTLGLLGFGSILVITGMLDDRFSISPAIRALVEVIVIALVVWNLDIYVTDLGRVLGSQVILLTGIVAMVFTTFAIIGVINAVNMVDGADGLLGSVSLVSVCAIAALIAGHENFETQLTLCLSMAGALFAFLLFNLRVFGLKRQVFMGDGGSIFLGYSIAFLLVTVTQGPNAAFDPVVAGWLVGLPLLDTMSVIVRRITKGQSPLTGGRDHFHHELIDFGLTQEMAVLVLVAVHSSMVIVGIVAHLTQLPDALFFWGFVAMTITHHFFTPRLLAKLSQRSVRSH
ncbi:MAG: MraY family glycosyltransferase [Granulosicoccus sp.]